MKKLLSVFCLSLLLAGCGANGNDNANDKVITVGASSTPHAEILNAVKDQVEAAGYTLEVKEFDDYVIPNTALEDGSLDANYFQHNPYLENFNKEHGTHLTAALYVHFEPLGIYAGGSNTASADFSLDQLNENDKIGVPNDGTNEARALQLLEAHGIIKLKEGVGLEATKLDIVENPKNIEIVELEAKMIPATLPDLAYGVINGNYALNANITDKVCVAEEKDSEGAQTFANVLAVRVGDEESEKTKVLTEALSSQAAKDFIEETYHGIVVSVID